jgi:arylsulfatase A-like enzyme
MTTSPDYGMQRPNFLFFITDQQRYDHVAYAGNTLLRTPNIDALASSGSWFSRFFVSSPTCMSSRATLMTGRIPSLHGVRMNGVPLDLDSVTFVDLLRAADYQTALIGKCHIQGMVEAPSKAPRTSYPGNLRPPPEALLEARRTHHNPERYTTEMMQVWNRTPDQAHKIELPYYGFDHVEFCLGHGDTVGGHYQDWLKSRAGTELKRGIDHAAETSAVGAPQVFKPGMGEECYPTRFVEEQTITYLEQHAARNADQPFFLQCSFPDPHHPFTPPSHYYSMYSPDDVQLPESFYKPNRDATPPVKFLWDEFEAGETSERWTYPFVTSEPKARDIVAKTYGQITMVDDAIGGVLSTLDRLGLRENTVLCFFSDHGDYLGDHGLMLKGPMHYQSIIRVPFVWNDPDPRYQRGRIDAPSSILDLAQTVLKRAGLQPYNGMQGHDLLSVLEGSDDNSDRCILVESTTQYPFLGFDDLVSVTTLVDKRWRLSVWQNCDWGELYDLESDPGELNNLWDDMDYRDTRSSLMLKLLHTIQNHAETSPYPMSVS